MPTQEEQDAFDAALDDPLWGIASPIPTLVVLAAVILTAVVVWFAR